MITHFRSTKRTPANGIERRPVPNMMAPERCVTNTDSVSADHVILIGRDLTGAVRVKVELSREDASVWWVKVIRHWLAWQYGASEIKLIS